MSLFLVALILIVLSFLLEAIGFFLLKKWPRFRWFVMGLGTLACLAAIVFFIIEIAATSMAKYQQTALLGIVFALLLGGLIPYLCWQYEKHEKEKGV